VYLRKGNLIFNNISLLNDEKEYHLRIFHKIKRETIKTIITLSSHYAYEVRMLPTVNGDHIIQLKYGGIVNEFLDLEKIIEENKEEQRRKKRIKEYMMSYGIDVNPKKLEREFIEYVRKNENKYYKNKNYQHLSEHELYLKQEKDFFKSCYGIDKELETQPPGTQPTGTQPTGTQPPRTQPIRTQPSGTQPTGTQPTGTQPPRTQPIRTQPSGPQPTGTQPTGPQPSGPQPTGTQPTGQQPTIIINGNTIINWNTNRN
jgi:hypothetical protein